MSGLSVFSLCLALALYGLPVQAASPIQEGQPVVLPGAQQYDLQSSQSGRHYRIFVAAPAEAPSASGYPVLYVLDGNAAFPVARFLARSVSARREVTGFQAPVVVGIGYPGADDFDVAARRRDYTIAKTKADAADDEGGAEAFLDFIEGELKRMMAARFPLDARRQALFGHSFGGLFVLHAAFTRPQAFTTYLASSPSIWWQEKQVLDGVPDFLKAADHQVLPRLMISVGALEDQPRKGNYSPETLAVLAKRPMVSEARNLAARLQAEPALTGRVRFYELEGEDHGPAWLPAMTRGMQFFMEQP